MFKNINNVARLSRLAGLAATVVSAVPALAQPIAYEGFNYPALGSLLAQNGGAGFSSPWQSAGYGVWYVWSSDSVYVKNGLSLMTSGRRATANQGGYQRLLNLETPIGNSPGTVWISFIAQQDAGVADQSWLGVTLPCTGSANPSLFLGKPFGQPNWGSDAGLAGSIRQTSKSSRTQALIVARIDTRNGADDVYMWVNPSLAVAPSIETADLVLPAYGNFQGITKVLVETGSSGPIASSGTIDEIRLGHSFADVAPVKPGVVRGGFAHVPLGQAILENTSPDMLSITHIGGTGQDGVEIALNSLGGSALSIAQEFTIPPGAHLAVAHRNWSGETTHTSTWQRTAGGDHQLVVDFSGRPGNPVTSVQMIIHDANGNVISDTTTPGSIAVGNVNPLVLGQNGGGLCSDGQPPRWYLDEFASPFSPVQGYTWGCPNGIMQNPRSNWVAVIAQFEPCPGCPSGSTGSHTVGVTAAGISAFSIGGMAAEYHGALASGLGDAMISQSCSDASDCSDPALHQLSIANNGGTGNDGVRFAL
ncbi:MAG: hypothetical protein AABZ53_16390, partial [Planctomycetota bacterium]